MNKEEQNVYDAKKAIKAHIKFFESLLKHLNGTDRAFKNRAMWTSWCLNNYMNNELMNDIQKRMKETAINDNNVE